ncbi:hypothetical protein GcM3_196022 [Golovinomyces cichoracearum]|uniref:Uncharacterized protein n=1 Tax=Golovinomyces cichoracearum TaxID=62708 RepID=A0A420HFR1_9PEZI|nr:hypothetical protein GcM3_196022 [Golovinomyces cichoracearum]
MANSQHEYASRRPTYPSYVKTSNFHKSPALNISTKISDLKREDNSSEYNGKQDFKFGLSPPDHNGIAFNRMDGKPLILRDVYNSLNEERNSTSRNVPEQSGKNMIIETYSRIPISSHPRPFEKNIFSPKNAEELTARTANGRRMKDRNFLEFLRLQRTYESESSISDRDGSPSPSLIITSKKYSRSHSAHVYGSHEAPATQENAKYTWSKYETDRSRKERILDYDIPLFTRSNLSQKLTDKRKTCADKVDEIITENVSDQDNLCISKPVAYSKANKTSGYLGKYFARGHSHPSKDMANTIASISAEYKNPSLIESNMHSISRSSGSSTSMSIQPKEIIQRSRESDKYPEVYDDIDISLTNLTTSPTLNIHLKKSDINESLVTQNVLVPKSGNVRESKFMNRDHHETHPTKTISNSLQNSRVKYQTTKLNTENEKIFDSQLTRHVDEEKNKTSGTYRSSFINDDEISDQVNGVQNLTHKKSDLKDEMSKFKSNVKSRVYEESRESYSEKKNLQDLDISYQATNSPPKTHKSLSPKINCQPLLETRDRNEIPEVDKEPWSPESKSVEKKNDFFSTGHSSGKNQDASFARCSSRSSSSKSPEGNMVSSASNKLCPPSKTDLNPEEHNDARAIKTELQSVEERDKFDSACLIPLSKFPLMKWDNNNQTPESKANTLAIQTPIITGAFIETPMPCLNPDRNYDRSTEKRTFSLECQKLKWETIIDSKTTSSQAQDLSQFKFPQRDVNTFQSKQIPINTAPRISASEDLRLIKIEQNVKDSVLDSYFQDAFNNTDVVTDIDHLISKSENKKSPLVGNVDFKSESPSTRKELYVDNITIERIRRKLNSTTDSINDTKRGIERLEKQFSSLSTDNNTKFKRKNDPLGTRLLSWFIVRTSSPRPQEPVGFFLNRNWKLTWLGFTISLIFVWYLSELAMCEAFCHPECSSTNTWQPSDPFFPWAIPTKLDQWTGNNVSKMIESILNWLDPKRNTRIHWPKQAYSGYDWWGGNFVPAPLHVLSPTNGGLGNIDDDNEVSS